MRFASSISELFRLRFDGPALAESKIAARDLARSLIAIEDLFVAADKLLNRSEDSSISLEVVSGFEQGSFEALLELTQEIPENLPVLIKSEQFKTVAQMCGWMLAPGGLLWLIVKLRGRKPTTVIESGANSTLVVGNENLTVVKNVYELHQHLPIRRNIVEVFQPLSKPGVEEIEIKTVAGEGTKIRGIDAESFSEESLGLTVDPKLISENFSTLYVRIVQAAFEDTYVWRFDSGGDRFAARMEDASFKARIDKGERFAKGDALLIRLRITQRLDDDQLKEERTVQEVLKHVEQGNLTQSEFEI